MLVGGACSQATVWLHVSPMRDGLGLSSPDRARASARSSAWGLSVGSSSDESLHLGENPRASVMVWHMPTIRYHHGLD